MNALSGDTQESGLADEDIESIRLILRRGDMPDEKNQRIQALLSAKGINVVSVNISFRSATIVITTPSGGSKAIHI